MRCDICMQEFAIYYRVGTMTLCKFCKETIDQLAEAAKNRKIKDKKLRDWRPGADHER